MRKIALLTDIKHPNHSSFALLILKGMTDCDYMKGNYDSESVLWECCDHKKVMIRSMIREIKMPHLYVAYIIYLFSICIHMNICNKYHVKYNII